jgi:hypothetical protein
MLLAFERLGKGFCNQFGQHLPACAGNLGLRNSFVHTSQYSLAYTITFIPLLGHGLLSPGAAIPTLFLPTVTLGFRPFGLGQACVFIVGMAAPNHLLWVFIKQIYPKPFKALNIH